MIIPYHFYQPVPIEITEAAAPVIYMCSYPTCIILDHNDKRLQFIDYELVVKNMASQRWIDEQYVNKPNPKVSIKPPAGGLTVRQKVIAAGLLISGMPSEPGTEPQP